MKNFPGFPNFSFEIKNDRMRCYCEYRVNFNGLWYKLQRTESYSFIEKSDDFINEKLNLFLDSIYKDILFPEKISGLAEAIANPNVSSPEPDKFQGDERDHYLKTNPHLI